MTPSQLSGADLTGLGAWPARSIARDEDICSGGVAAVRALASVS